MAGQENEREEEKWARNSYIHSLFMFIWVTNLVVVESKFEKEMEMMREREWTLHLTLTAIINCSFFFAPSLSLSIFLLNYSFFALLSFFFSLYLPSFSLPLSCSHSCLSIIESLSFFNLLLEREEEEEAPYCPSISLNFGCVSPSNILLFS